MYVIFSEDGLTGGGYLPGVNCEEPPPGSVEIKDDAWWDFCANPGTRRWNGAEIEVVEPPPLPPVIPEIISDRQFAQALALDGTITQDEALAWAARGDLPAALKAALAQIPETGGQRFAAQMLLSAATTYERGHPLVPVLGALLGKDAAALDDIWTRAEAL